MGFPMANHLINSQKYKVIVWNRTIEKANPFKEKAKIANSIEEAMSSDILISMMFDYRSVYDAFFGTQERISLLKGKTVIQMCTVNPKENVELKKLSEEAGASFFECPVLGVSTLAQSKQLQMLVGSSVEQFEKYKGLLSNFGPNVFYIGEVPAASSIKLCFNQIVLSQITCISHSCAMLEKDKLPVDIFMQILRNAQFYSKYYDLKLSNIQNRQYTPVLFDVAGAAKDAQLIANHAKELGINASSLEEMANLFVKAANQTTEPMDASFVNEAINPKQ